MKLKDHISTGNSKVPYYIFNITSATDCASEKYGLCQVADICYAKKAERMYKHVLPYRRRQEQYWDSQPNRLEFALDFCAELMAIQERSRKMPKVLRFSEAGDFRNQDDVDTMAYIARSLKHVGWKVYGYTCRVDLDLAGLLAFAAVNLSLDDDNYVLNMGANRFKAVDQPTGDNFVCRGDCSKCKVCMNVRGKTIEVIKH